MRDKESFNAVYRSLNAYVSETARFEEAFADIRHYLQELTKAERETIIRDDLWQYALKTDYESGALSGDVRNVATALIVRLWAAMGPADELGVYLFDYIKRTDEKWHDFWANKVLPQLRSSSDEYRKQFSKTALDAIEENCGLLERNASVSPTLIGMAAATRKTIERIRYEAERPKNEKPGEKAAPSVRSEYGPWKIKRSLSEGGQARTFLVQKEGDGQLFVLKRLKNPDRVRRFQKEIEASVRLEHKNIVKILDHNIEREPYYFVAEYCEGGALRAYEPHRELTLLDKLGMFLQICAGVAFAQSHINGGIIHRDLKPDNIFVRADGTPVVGDFGICFTGDHGERLTLVDEPVGPRNYIAPELEDGRAERIGSQCDVYSLGKLLYWMLTGREFAREKHRDPEFDLTKKDPTSEHFLINELLDRMVIADPAKRFKDANELAYAVEALIERIQAGGHVMDLSAPQRCLYCAEGQYKVVVEPLFPNQKDSRRQASTFGFTTGLDHALWGIFVCNNCGNVQIFRPDQAKDPKVWKKS